MDTERLYLREIKVEDVEDLYKVYEHPSVTKYMENLFSDHNLERKFAEDYIKNVYRFYGYGVWLVCLKENDIIIGRAGLSNREIDGINRLELGYVIQYEYQHKGYAAEACKGILEFVKNQELSDEVICITEPENVQSVKLAEVLGFELKDYISQGENEAKKTYAYYTKKI